MNAKDILDIIDEADCNVDICFIDSEGNWQPLGWAKKLIEISFRAGEERGYNKCLADLKTYAKPDK